MKIPKKLKIGGHIYQVEMADFSDDADRFGEIEEGKNIIRLDKNQTQDQLEVTLFHEILGACNPTLHAKDHMLMASLAEQIYAVLKNNNLLK